jgi:hypothetical protein
MTIHCRATIHCSNCSRMWELDDLEDTRPGLVNIRTQYDKTDGICYGYECVECRIATKTEAPCKIKPVAWREPDE